MSITKDDVAKVANLARLDLSSAEQEEFVPQLNAILDYFEQLQELDTENVEPTTRAIDVQNVTREDELKPYAEIESLLDSAPQREEDFFRVPRIMG